MIRISQVVKASLKTLIKRLLVDVKPNICFWNSNCLIFSSREPGRRSMRIGDYFDENKDGPEVNLRGSSIPYLECDLSCNGLSE